MTVLSYLCIEISLLSATLKSSAT